MIEGSRKLLKLNVFMRISDMDNCGKGAVATSLEFNVWAAKKCE